MEKKLKHNFLLVAFGVGLFALLMNLPAAWGFVKKVIGIIMPVFVGGILALFFNVPMTAIEKGLRRISGRMKRPVPDKVYRVAAFVLTLLLVSAALAFVLMLLIPELVKSVKGIYVQIEARLPQWISYLEQTFPEAKWLEDMLSGIQLNKIAESIGTSLNLIFKSVADMVFSTANAVMTAVFGLIIGIYTVLGKERVYRHANKFVQAYIHPRVSGIVLQFCRKFNRSFSKFLSGQCGEAVILGTLMFIGFSIFRLPYASLIGVLTAVCAIIPYVGAVISCSLSIFLTLLIAPELVLRCAAVYLVIQFIENQFIYPRVVGGSVGLPPLYTLIAAMIGGKLFGIIGILFFIPLAAVIIEILRDNAGKRLQSQQKEMAGKG